MRGVPVFKTFVHPPLPLFSDAGRTDGTEPKQIPMKKHIFYALVFFAFGFSGLLFSCSGCHPEDRYRLTDLSPDEIDSTRFDALDRIYEDRDSSLKVRNLGQGATWRLWRKLHKECMADQWLKSPFYLGVTGKVNLGAVVDENFDLQRMMDSTNGFTAANVADIVVFGEFATCGYSQELTMSLSTFFQAELDMTGSGQADVALELSAAIKHSKSTWVKIDRWRKNHVQEDKLMDYAKDPSKAKYFETLHKPKHRVMIRVVEVQGFTSSIVLENDMSAKLEAKLKEGVVAGMGNAGAQVKFTYKDKRTIEVKSGGNFYVFGEFKKAEKVTES